ncbi:hypothetical protein WKI68_24545 [Streptomyces sp. MS1.HAVA.3]|uniref:Secreted protein n=1 Tax=Streptomyces caledonius TaxID=3134107 RepID=A0ABU8U718_9ACTN
MVAVVAPVAPVARAAFAGAGRGRWACRVRMPGSGLRPWGRHARANAGGGAPPAVSSTTGRPQAIARSPAASMLPSWPPTCREEQPSA